MSVFTEKEIAYLNSQQLGRLATINKTGAPHVVPVGFRYNVETDTIDIGGHNLGQSKKFQDAINDDRVAFVVDDVLPPWQPRGIEIRGRAEVFTTGGTQIGPGFAPELIRIHPQRLIGWGLDTDAFKPHSRTVK